MEFHRDHSVAANVIKALGNDGLRVGEQRLCAPCVITPQRVVTDWPVASAADLDAGDLADFVAEKPELILFGSGSKLQFPSPEVGRQLAAHGIGFEVMDTAAACRTYNVLVHEGRHVIAALVVAVAA